MRKFWSGVAANGSVGMASFSERAIENDLNYLATMFMQVTNFISPGAKTKEASRTGLREARRALQKKSY